MRVLPNWLAGLLLLQGGVALAAPELTLEQAMANPDWIGNAPESAYLDAAGSQVLFQPIRVKSTY